MSSNKNGEDRTHTAVALSGTSKQVLEIDSHGIVEIQNVHASITVWIRTDGQAATKAAPCFKLVPGQMYTSPGAFTGSITGIADSGTPSISVAVDKEFS